MAQIYAKTATAAPRRSLRTPHPGLFGRLFDYIGLARQRRALARLDAEQLRDIGITEEEAEIEAGRAIWDVPAHWRR